MTRIYHAALIMEPPTALNQTTFIEEPRVDPEGWREFCLDRYGEVRDFFLPDLRRVYRSRSSAADLVRAVHRWGGVAQIMVAEVEFRPESEVKQAREAVKKLDRAAKLRREAAALEAEVARS